MASSRVAPRANWMRLSLVTCPVALYPATSETEKISFNQISKKTGHRIKYLKVDADTGEEVSSDEITKGYKVDIDGVMIRVGRGADVKTLMTVLRALKAGA
jgi:non-homologous end joining protein Ku